jgi:acetylornithine deacetylase
VKISGKPAHVLDTSAGVNAIQAAVHLYNSLKVLEERYNAPECRHAAYSNSRHPVNFNFGIIKGALSALSCRYLTSKTGGDWASSVPAACQFDVRVGFFPGTDLSAVRADIEQTLVAAAKTYQPGAAPVSYTLHYRGFQAEGCTADLNAAPFQSFKQAFTEATGGRQVAEGPVTCTTDARFFLLYCNIPTSCYGPEAKAIHGIGTLFSLPRSRNTDPVFCSRRVRVARVHARGSGRVCRLYQTLVRIGAGPIACQTSASHPARCKGHHPCSGSCGTCTLLVFVSP